MEFSEQVSRFRIDRPDRFRLADFDPRENCGLDIEKKEARDLLAQDVARLSDLQERLYADHRWAVLLVFQGMDAAGKDGAIKHVMSGVNPQGCQVHSFKAPSARELDHDFLWRTTRVLPQRGHIGIFNRSHYEEVLIVRVRPEFLARQNLPAGFVSERIWQERFESIRSWESHLARSGTVILKFFLNLSREEQRQRFLSRIDEPAKRWKFSMGDVAERALWDRYMDAYEDMIRYTSTPEAPWYAVPADRKWLTRIVVARAIVDRLEALGLEFPKVEGEALAGLQQAREALDAEAPRNGKKNQR
jgi:PPK2 family polyphosphate:nucleotide phosphotransferase